MSSTNETHETIQKLLEPYVFPREEVACRRRILSAYLESCVGDGPLSSPLALVQPSGSISIPAEARGLHKEYLKALNANVSARTAYDTIQAEISRGPKSESGAAHPVSEPTTSNPLEDHLVKLKLQRKQERLRIIEKHIGLLNQKPAASATFLDPDEILRETAPLPDVPHEVVEGVALGDTSSKTDLKDLVDRLERQVLRARLLLKSEERLLDAVKGCATVRPESVDGSAKLHALNVTRTELINWMETELSKVPAEDDQGDEVGDAHGGGPAQVSVDSGEVDEQLADIRSKYSQYLAARKFLLQLVAQQPPLPGLPPASSDPSAAEQEPRPAAPAPTTYLLTPYLERLLSLAREQKGLIAQKSHVNTTITKQLKETAQLLDHLAEESNLLPSHPMPGSTSRRRPPGLGDALGAPSETPGPSGRVKPWVYAADSAKIATLEAVAEKIEEGQLSLEGSMGAVREIERLLGRSRVSEWQPAERADVTEDDVWLAEDKPSGRAGAARKHARKESVSKNGTDLWAFLDGSLGLLRANDE